MFLIYAIRTDMLIISIPMDLIFGLSTETTSIVSLDLIPLAA